MLEREYGRWILACDVCEARAKETFDSFHEAQLWRRQNGWRTYPNGANWLDECPGCKSTPP